MQHANFVPLHLHTEYSLLDGAIKIDELVAQAAAFKMPAVAITDHGGLFGAVEFYKKAIKAGVKPIIGCEVYVAPQSRLDRARVSFDGSLSEEATFHLILLARNATGYRNLTSLVSKAYLEGFYYKPRIDKALLEQYSGGLIGLSACLKGEVPYYLRAGNLDRAREAALQYKHILGPENFYFELQHNGLPEQEEVNRQLIALGEELHIPLVATNDCHYLKKEDAKAHDILLCIQTGKIVKDEKRLKMTTEEFYFKSPEEMQRAFRDLPEAVANTLTIAERCNFEFTLGKNLLPRYELPEGVSPDSYLDTLAAEGLAKKFKDGPAPADYRERLSRELQMIKKMGFSSYFLIVWDFISFARQKGIPVGPGRGSAAGSLVAYCLGITEIDPLRYNLLFERFLNPERVSMPDIDVDFCKDRRGEVIEYVAGKYGDDHVAQIITFGTMAAKAAIRDVGRVLDIPYADVDRIAKLVPNNASIEEAIKLEPQLKELYETNAAVKELLDIAQRLEGLSRHASTHAAGVVIAPEPLTGFTALYKNPAEETITTQFDMGSVESVGLLKFDFLGLKTLTVLEKTVAYIRQQGKEIVLSDLPLDDEATYKLLSAGETTGIFQLESDGMRDILVKMQPNRFEDLIALVALYRPGPIGSGMIDDFIKRKKGETPVVYDLPQLKEILDETYGVILYQEQVMRIANKIANFSLGQADLLRRAMGKKKPEEMEKQQEGFMKGALANGIAEKKAQRLFELMAYFAEYGFNKSHSAAYAYLAYQTAYLKAHYPVEFMTANLSADMGDTDKIVKLIGECRSMAIEILPPDINLSEREFKISENSIRFGLEAVKGVGTAAIEIMLLNRRDGQNGAFASFEDFLRRMDNKKVNKKVIESLIKAGAFDSLAAEPRGDAKFRARAQAMETLTTPARSQGLGPGLFGELGPAPGTLQPWDEKTLLAYEKEALGFYISGHPLARYRRTLAAMEVAPLVSLETRDDRSELLVAGIISDMKSKAKEKGVTAFLTLEDETGSCDVLVFPALYREHADFLRKGTLVMVRGQVAKAEKGAKLMARELKDLTGLEVSMKYEVALRCETPEKATETFGRIRSLLGVVSDGGDKVSLSFKVYLPDCCVTIASHLKPAQNFVAEIEKITGGTVRVY